MSYAGYKRPGGGGGGGALVQVKRPRQDLVVAGGDARSRQLIQSVSEDAYLNNAHHGYCTSLQQPLIYFLPLISGAT